MTDYPHNETAISIAVEVEKLLDGAPDPETAATALTIAASRFMSRSPNQSPRHFMVGLQILTRGIADLWMLKGAAIPPLAPWPWAKPKPAAEGKPH